MIFCGISDQELLVLTGLLIDIVGVVVLHRHGLMPKDITDLIYTKSQEGVDAKELLKNHEKWSRLGLTLLLIGFTMQILAPLIL